MLDLELQSRIAKNYSDAAVGYASAMTAAYGHAASMMIDFWADTLKTSSPKPANSQSWYREPTRSSTALAPMMAPLNPFQAINPFAISPMAMNPVALAMGPGLAAGAMLPWMSMMLPPPTGRSAAVPMAYMMLAVGVPRDVAEPAAEANAALIEAGEAVAQSVDNTFSSYRSDGGHAVAQIMHYPGRAVVAAMMFPLSSQAMLFPWLTMARHSF
jgi:hypothetical protein